MACTHAFFARFLLTSIFVLIWITVAGAQERRGTISGHVSDSAGAVLQGAQIELEPRAATTTSDGQGEFTTNGSPIYPIQREFYKTSYMVGLRYTLSNEPN